MLPLDIETYYPWPDQGDFPQPTGPDNSLKKLKKRRSLGKAHPYAKDPRRCAIRFLTTELDGVLYTHDFLTEPELPEKLKDALAHSTLVGHNLDFDVTVLRRYGIELSSTWIDTMLAARLLGLGKERGSEDEELEGEEEGEIDQAPVDNPADNGYGPVVVRYLGTPLAKDCGGSDWSGTPTPEQLEYIKNDVIHLIPLWEVLEPELHAAKLYECFLERMEFAPRLNAIKMAGIPIDIAPCESDREQAQEDIQVQKERIQAAFPDLLFPVPKSRCKKPRRDKKGSAVEGSPPPPETEPLNPNKSEHIVGTLASRGIRVENAQKDTLARVDAPEALLFIDYIKAKSRLTTIKGIADSAFPDGRVRASGWNQIAARTGRLHSVKPNLQNIPRVWRKPFRALGGCQWLKSDLSMIEMVLIALYYHCEPLRDLLAQGLDVYVHTAAGVFGKEPIRCEAEVSELLRKVAKTLTLGISYVLGVRAFISQVRDQTGVEYTPEQAQGFYANFFRMFPEIKQAHERARIDALTVDSVYTITGQRRFLPPLLEEQDLATGWWPSRERRARILVNTPIQGSCANLYIRALNLIIPRLPAKVEIVNLVHDEVDLIVPNGLELEAKQIVTQGFQEAFRSLYGDQLPIRMEHAIGPSWAEGMVL
jgi:DNA polymerase-1